MTNINEFVIFSLVGYPKHSDLNEEVNFGEVFSDNDNHDLPMETFQISDAMIVVAIDVGTTFSGYSFVFTHDKSRVRYMRNSGKDSDSIHKVPTILLIDPNKKFKAFGYEAQNYYNDLTPKERKRWFYFENFKMDLNVQTLNNSIKLISTNGQTLKAKLVFTEVLKHLCLQAMMEISDQLAFQLTKQDIRWVVTVPALWNESAKQFMREAALETGLIIDNSLYIALEPEVASLYCRQLDCKMPSPLKAIEQGFKYAVIDAGGGSVDVTFHQIQSNGYMKEIYKSSGLQLGSFEINKSFEQILSKIFGFEIWLSLQRDHPSIYFELMDKFELRKREFCWKKPTKQSYNLTLSFAFMQFISSKKLKIENLFRRKHCPNGLRYDHKLGIIRIGMNLMIQLFDNVIEPMRRHIKRQINQVLEEDRLHFAFIVGGFAQSQLLRQRLKTVLEPETLVVIPPSPHLAVMHGAALYGLDPTIIRSRRAMRTYGIGVLAKMDSLKNIKSTKTQKTIIKNGEQWSCDVFDRFVTINQEVGLFQTITRRYKPVHHDQQFCILHIYSTERESVHFVTEPDVIKCGSIYMELEQLNQPNQTINPAIEKLVYTREIEAQMFFGETQIKVQLVMVYYIYKNLIRSCVYNLLNR
ncbi:hypothetical protein BLOT_015505 [Blomia tropicalis]|nr:hypothetical protein BLOT_015505 [Blomia tropicalis]